MMKMFGANQATISTKFCLVSTAQINEVELSKLTKLGLRPEDVSTEKARGGDRNPVIEETGYVGMTT